MTLVFVFLAYMMKINAKDRNLAEEKEAKESLQIIHACLLTSASTICVAFSVIKKPTIV